MTTTIETWAAAMANLDREACALAGTSTDATWTGEHTTALADHLGCQVAEIPADVLATARAAYARAAAG